jgi:NAD(P)-dependent dehydrogenase (short-subunit alcohol dehydrogenase family)
LNATAEAFGRVGILAANAGLAQALLFPASPQAAMITGHTLMVDGGWTTLSPIA